MVTGITGTYIYILATIHTNTIAKCQTHISVNATSICCPIEGDNTYERENGVEGLCDEDDRAEDDFDTEDESLKNNKDDL